MRGGSGQALNKSRPDKMHVDTPRVLVWPNQDIFKHGILAGFPASFGTAENLSKFLMYCRTKGKNGWPNVWLVIKSLKFLTNKLTSEYLHFSVKIICLGCAGKI